MFMFTSDNLNYIQAYFKNEKTYFFKDRAGIKYTKIAVKTTCNSHRTQYCDVLCYRRFPCASLA